MSYLSKIVLNPLRSTTQQLLASPQRIHAAVLGGLAQQPVGERVLWRVESRPHAVELLVLTEARPSWEHIVEQAGWPGADGSAPLIADYAPVLALVMKGRRFGFRVRVNPTTTSHTVEKTSESQERVLATGRGVRLGHRTAQTQLAWFLDRAANNNARWGFTVGDSDNPTAALVARERVSFRRSKGDAPVTLDTATFEGALTITDAELFTDVLLTGIGRGKAYGCGLLTVAAART